MAPNIRRLQLAMEVIQQGDLETAERLLRLAIKEDGLTGALLATAHMLMAETKSTRQEKLDCLNEALSADPQNADVNNRIAALLSEGIRRPTLPGTGQLRAPETLPPANPPTPAPPPPPISAAENASGRFYRTVGIVDGHHGQGTGFFVSSDGLIVTTRHVVDSMEMVTVSLDPGLQLQGRVVRSFPEIDLALIRINYQVTQLLSFTNMPSIPPQTALTVVAHNGKVAQGVCRETRRPLKPGWFPTTISASPDAGGGPVFDSRNFVVGMLTRNTSRSSEELFGLNIFAIRQYIDQYLHEIHIDPQKTYCPSCGCLSRAIVLGGFYCESCGAVLPQARGATRSPIPSLAGLYQENQARACNKCGARMGFYDGKCLRCGLEG